MSSICAQQHRAKTNQTVKSRTVSQNAVAQTQHNAAERRGKQDQAETEALQQQQKSKRKQRINSKAVHVKAESNASNAETVRAKQNNFPKSK